MDSKIQKILKEQLELIKLSEAEVHEINKVGREFSEEFREKLKNKKINGEVFIGGSLAKNTLVKKDAYDIDVFVRINEQKNISRLKEILPNAKKIHGSRDYYQIKRKGIIIEIIPVLKISKPEDSINVTDLSYFHVNYVLKKIKNNKKLVDEIILAKSFAHGQDCYGAESYIKGFSGYALELLVCHYKSFLNFIKEISKLDFKKILVIDDAKFYKNKNIMEEINKAKISSIILIDPTFKERNTVSSLSKETLIKFQNACKSFLKSPSYKFFIKKPVFENFRKYKNVKIVKIKTNKQAGDISGTKSKKFFGFFISRLKKTFDIKKSGFEYNKEKNIANFYFVLNKKKSNIVKGPPVSSINNLTNFKKAHQKAFIKKGFVYAKLTYNSTFNHWFKNFLKKDKKIIEEMGVKSISN
ncbi:MAG: nucleotidyltransferase domain-containing protein [Nanoarchaeota archaeon]|mgnify:CR=1 FL=1